MSLLDRFGRETVAAALLAGIVVAAGTVAWLGRRSDGPAVAGGHVLALDASIPADSNVLAGTLRNGVHYFVRANTAPVQRIELRLVVVCHSTPE